MIIAVAGAYYHHDGDMVKMMLTFGISVAIFVPLDNFIDKISQ